MEPFSGRLDCSPFRSVLFESSKDGEVIHGGSVRGGCSECSTQSSASYRLPSYGVIPNGGIQATLSSSRNHEWQPEHTGIVDSGACGKRQFMMLSSAAVNSFNRFLELPGVVQGLCTLIGALISALVAIVIYRKNIRAKRLSIFISPIRKMLDVNELIRSQVQIRFHDNAIQNLFASDFTLQNSGNQPVENLSVCFRKAESTAILSFHLSGANFPFFDKRVKIKEVENGFDIAITFLNRSEKISFDYTWTGEKALPQIDAAQPGLDIQRREPRPDTPDFGAP
jgi:hypothetical protein